MAPTNETDDGREIVAINRIPAGHTVYPTGCGDGVASSPGYRNGTNMILDHATTSVEFQMLSHWYGIGGRVFWEGADLTDYVSAWLKAPATVGTNATGDFDKVALGGGANVYVPSAPGAGAWSLNLAATHPSTSVLKCVPVPSPTNTGYFDYNPSTNVLAANLYGQGGYNLFDFEVSMFCFAHKVWGRKQDGAESSLEIPDVVGKLLLNSWKVVFNLTTIKTSGIKVGAVLITAIRSNV